MRDLVVCCDGTWNTPDEDKGGVPTPTNVAKLRNALTQDESQLVYYHSGIGTGHGWWDHVVGGGTGAGLDQITMSAYEWLARIYQPNDRIFLFGFSRGAYTARSCNGLLSRYGLLDLSAVDTSQSFVRVGELFESYRSRQDFANPKAYPFHNQRPGASQKGTTPVYFIGVWDTVGALGIPNDFAVLGLLDRPEDYRFHDTELNDTVAFARHAVALDERRASFAPTFWSKVGPHTDAKQLWFPGTHGDVGGGYLETGLSDGALLWMIEEAEARELRFHDGIETQIEPDPLGPLHVSLTGIFAFLKSRPRSVPPLVEEQPDLHQSTRARLSTQSIVQGAYWPTERIASGAPVVREVFAKERWNDTGLYLEAGVRYAFSASGQWLDHKDVFGPDGSKDGFSFGDVARFASSILGGVETIYKNLRHSPDTDFWWTRRLESAPWFALIGFVANDVMAAGSDVPDGETFVIGNQCVFTPARGGYLYGFANDAWQTYANNRGGVKMTVSRA